GETQAGKGSLPFDHAGALGAIGATGSLAANRIAAEADVIIGIGTRYSDFTTASKTAFQNPDVHFVNVNISEADGHKLGGIALTGDARATIEQLDQRLAGGRVPGERRSNSWTNGSRGGRCRPSTASDASSSARNGTGKFRAFTASAT